MPSKKCQWDFEYETKRDSIWSLGQSGHSSHFQLHLRFAMEQHEAGRRNDTRLCVQCLGSEGFEGISFRIAGKQFVSIQFGVQESRKKSFVDIDVENQPQN